MGSPQLFYKLPQRKTHALTMHTKISNPSWETMYSVEKFEWFRVNNVQNTCVKDLRSYTLAINNLDRIFISSHRLTSKDSFGNAKRTWITTCFSMISFAKSSHSCNSGSRSPYNKHTKMKRYFAKQEILHLPKSLIQLLQLDNNNNIKLVFHIWEWYA